MRPIGLAKAVWMVYRYQKLSSTGRRETQEKRLRALVDYARENSPYFRRLYASIPSDFHLSDLRPTDKVEMMANFDEWLTDRRIRLSDIHAFMENPDNIGRKLKGDYLVFTTSGSTGNPSIVLCDETANNIMGATNLLRSIARPEDMKALMKRGFKTAGVYATGGFYLGYSSVRARLLSAPQKKHQMMVTSILKPLPEIVRELNDFQPAMLGGYPTALELLMEEQRQGRLRITPSLIMAGGEYLSAELRKALSGVFACYVQASYSCTEGRTVAYECAHQHFHINDDWVIVEAVDRENRPVPNGVQSDKILLTNLSNFTQPFIRYEITDRVIMHHETCPCGSLSPWLEVEGRTDEILTFDGDKGKVRIAPLALYALIKEVPDVRRFQLIGHPENRLELRLVCADEESRRTACQDTSRRLRSYLLANGVSSVNIQLSDEVPQPHPNSGKFKHVYQETGEV